MKTPTQKLNNVIGQVEGIKRMIEHKDDCISILTQIKAVRSALGSVMDSLVEEQMDTCMKSLSKEDKKLFINIKKYVKTN